MDYRKTLLFGYRSGKNCVGSEEIINKEKLCFLVQFWKKLKRIQRPACRGRTGGESLSSRGRHTASPPTLSGSPPSPGTPAATSFPEKMLEISLHKRKLGGGSGAKPQAVRTMDLILRSIERRLQMQFSMAHKFRLQRLRWYSVIHSKMCKSARHLA